MRCHAAGCGAATGQLCARCKRPVCRAHRQALHIGPETGARSVVCPSCAKAEKRRWTLFTTDGPDAA